MRGQVAWSCIFAIIGVLILAIVAIAIGALSGVFKSPHSPCPTRMVLMPPSSWRCWHLMPTPRRSAALPPPPAGRRGFDHPSGSAPPVNARIRRLGERYASGRPRPATANAAAVAARPRGAAAPLAPQRCQSLAPHAHTWAGAAERRAPRAHSPHAGRRSPDASVRVSEPRARTAAGRLRRAGARVSTGRVAQVGRQTVTRIDVTSAALGGASRDASRPSVAVGRGSAAASAAKRGAASTLIVGAERLAAQRGTAPAAARPRPGRARRGRSSCGGGRRGRASSIATPRFQRLGDGALLRDRARKSVAPSRVRRGRRDNIPRHRARPPAPRRARRAGRKFAIPRDA